MKRAAGRLCVFLVTGTWLLPSARAQSRLDSLQRLDEVVIEAQTPVKEVIPAQRLAGDGLQRLGAHSVADAIRYFSGVQIKDYGGVGGLKTVNIRSMGTNHVGVFYDGIELGNAQNGVVDLGRFSLDNMEVVTLYNGQKSAIFRRPHSRRAREPRPACRPSCRGLLDCQRRLVRARQRHGEPLQTHRIHHPRTCLPGLPGSQ